jgi:hypothetical protein
MTSDGKNAIYVKIEPFTIQRKDTWLGEKESSGRKRAQELLKVYVGWAPHTTNGRWWPKPTLRDSIQAFTA